MSAPMTHESQPSGERRTGASLAERRPCFNRSANTRARTAFPGPTRAAALVSLVHDVFEEQNTEDGDDHIERDEKPDGAENGCERRPLEGLGHARERHDDRR